MGWCGVLPAASCSDGTQTRSSSWASPRGCSLTMASTCLCTACCPTGPNCSAPQVRKHSFFFLSVFGSVFLAFFLFLFLSFFFFFFLFGFEEQKARGGGGGGEEEEEEEEEEEKEEKEEGRWWRLRPMFSASLLTSPKQANPSSGWTRRRANSWAHFRPIPWIWPRRSHRPRPAASRPWTNHGSLSTKCGRTRQPKRPTWVALSGPE